MNARSDLFLPELGDVYAMTDILFGKTTATIAISQANQVIGNQVIEKVIVDGKFAAKKLEVTAAHSKGCDTYLGDVKATAIVSSIGSDRSCNMISVK
jgi:hypothetical protein